MNKIAVLDPNDTPVERHASSSGLLVMKEVLTIAGPTPDPEFVSTFPQAVREWCINTAAVDPFTRSVMVNSEDGTLYRWDLTANTLSQAVTLSSGIGEAYTPTVIGPDGTVYAINQAILDAVGQRPTISINDVNVAEGNSGTTSGAFTVSLSSASTQTVTVDYATADGTATVAGNDYQSVSGALTFAPGQTTKTISVLVKGDTVNEADETFVVNLSNDYAPQSGILTFGPGETSKTIAVAVIGDTGKEGKETFFVKLGAAVNAAIARAQGRGTIVNDDKR